MTARLKALPDALRGGAWPSPARVVRCLVKSSKPLCGVVLCVITGCIGWLVCGMLIEDLVRCQSEKIGITSYWLAT